MRVTLMVIFLILSTCCLAQKQKIVLDMKGLPHQRSVDYPKNFIDSISALKAIKQEIIAAQFLGYLYADISEINLKNDTITAQLNLGPLSKGIYLSNGNLPQEIIVEANLKDLLIKKNPCTIQNLNKIYQNILGYLENNGYPFAQVWLDSLSSKNQTLAAKIYYNPQRKIIIDTLRLIGNAKISDRFLAAYLGIKKEQNYNESKIKQMDKKLRDLSYLSIPKPPEVVFSGEKAKINLFMNKRNANQFDGIIGFLPNANNGKLQITGDFKLSLQNALKSGESLDFNYRGLPSQSQELALKLKYPYIFSSQLGFDFDFQLFKRDTSFLNLNSKIAFAYNFNTTQKLSFFLENFTGNPVADLSTPTQNIPPFANIKSIYYGLAGSYLKLDDKITPLKGADFVIQASVGNRKINSSKNFNPTDYFEKKSTIQYKFMVDLKYYLKVGTKSVLLLHNSSAYLSGNNLFTNEAFRIGGFKTLRGFDEQSINTSTFSIQTLEYRYLIEKNSYLCAFYDQAYIQQNFVNKQNKDFPLGLGVGITFQTKVGIASLNYALGKQKNNPVDLQRGKIHFGITSYF